MKPPIFTYFLAVALLSAGCSPQTEAECLMEVSKHAQSDKAAILGKMACDKQFSSTSSSETHGLTQRSALPLPEPGDEIDGYVFIGGNPEDKESWIESASTLNQRIQSDIIEKSHPGWLTTVKSLDFATWMISQPEEIKALADSDKASDAIRMLDLFEEAQLEIANND